MHTGKRHHVLSGCQLSAVSCQQTARRDQVSTVSRQQAADWNFRLEFPKLLSGTLLTALAVIMMAGCGANQPEPTVDAVSTKAAAAPKPTRGLPEAMLPGGGRLILELALTQEEIGQGLMFRNSLPPDRGMLFLFGEERVRSFWMKNTLIPLDMVFLSPEGVIVDVIHKAQPCTMDPCPRYVSKARALAVLEVAAGVAESHGLDEGVRLDFERVPGFPREAAP